MPTKRQPSVWNTHKKHYILQVLGAFSKTLILLGFVWIDEKGKSAPTNEACAINCALKGAEFSTFYVVWLHQKGRKSALTNDNCPTSCPLTEGGDFSIIFFLISYLVLLKGPEICPLLMKCPTICPLRRWILRLLSQMFYGFSKMA